MRRRHRVRVATLTPIRTHPIADELNSVRELRIVWAKQIFPPGTLEERPQSVAFGAQRHEHFLQCCSCIRDGIGRIPVWSQLRECVLVGSLNRVQVRPPGQESKGGAHHSGMHLDRLAIHRSVGDD